MGEQNAPNEQLVAEAQKFTQFYPNTDKILSSDMNILFALSALLATVTGQLEIVRGKEAAIGKHLYLASLRHTTDGTTYCGGSMIGPSVILIAAHQ
ncbi:hypothetical protein LEN26_003614 [Aphanomyces euteiches]|nr:hypothetical protein AeMF1_014724 [Aphanomyces euteiches]KAH9152998.1 hypothetical protein LEN26_003614 [Aphanomyces euteiches]